MSLRYRHILETDIAGISRVHRRACLVAYKFMDWSHSEDEVRDWYAGKFGAWDWGLVAEDETKVLGFIVMSGAHIDQLFVDPDYQMIGIGTAMMITALARMRTPITLTVHEANSAARRFYERHGFREVGREFNENDMAVELVYRRDGKSD